MSQVNLLILRELIAQFCESNVMSLQLLPSELFSLFNLSLPDLIHIYQLNSHLRQLIINSNEIKLKDKIVFTRNTVKWIKYLINVECKDISLINYLTNVRTLDLSETKVTDVSTLGNVHKLNLSNTKVTDVSALGNIHTLDLRFTKVTDVSALGKVHTLDLSDTKVTDVSALGKVHTLNLSDTKVED